MTLLADEHDAADNMPRTKIAVSYFHSPCHFYLLVNVYSYDCLFRYYVIREANHGLVRWVNIATGEETSSINKQRREALVKCVRKLYDNNYKDELEGLKAHNGNLLSIAEIRGMIRQGENIEANILYSQFEQEIEQLKKGFLQNDDDNNVENVNDNVNESANVDDQQVSNAVYIHVSDLILQS